MSGRMIKILISDQTKTLIKKFNIVLNDTAGQYKNWNFVEKKKLISFLNEMQDDAIFQDLKNELSVCQLDLLFLHHEVGSDSLVFCLTDDATEEIIKQIGLYDPENYDTLKITCHRLSKSWENSESDKEIIESKALNQRALRTVEAIVPIQPGKKQQYLQNISKEKQKINCASFSSNQFQTDLLHRRTIDVNLQSCSLQDAKIQTTLNLPSTMWTLWEPQLKSEEDLSVSEIQDLTNFLEKNVQQVLREVHYNSMPNIYQNCYENLCSESQDSIFQQDFSYKISHSISQKENVTAMSCYSWHPKNKDLVIIAYRVDMKYCVPDMEPKEIDFNIPDTNLVQIRDCAVMENMGYLESPCELSSISFCPYNPRLIVGGCINGQLVLWDTIEDINHETKAEEKQILRFSPTLVSPTYHKKEISSIHWLPRKIKVTKSGAIRNDEIASVQVMSLSEDGFIFVWDFLELPHTQSDSTNEQIIETVSPFASLHNIIKPVFKLALSSSAYRGVITASCIMSTSVETLSQESHEIKFPPKKFAASTYDEVTDGIVKEDLKVFIGSIEGSISLINISADCQLNEDEVHEVKIKNSTIFHDGPVLCLRQSPLDSNLVLSIGGHTFAIWNQNIYRQPIYLKSCKHYLSSGAWSLFKQSLIYIFGENGTLQVWDFLNDKCEMLNQYYLIPGPLKALPYELKSQRNQYLPFCDSQATLYFCKIPQGHLKIDKSEHVKIRDRFSKELRQRPSSSSGKRIEGWLSESKVKTMLKQYRHQEECFLESEREALARREHNEFKDLTSQLVHWDVGVRKETNRRLELINHLPKTLLTLKNIDKQILIKTHEPVVQLEDQKLKKKLLFNKRVDQCLEDIDKQEKRIFQKKIDTLPSSDEIEKVHFFETTEEYFQQFKQQEEDIVTNFE